MRQLCGGWCGELRLVGCLTLASCMTVHAAARPWPETQSGIHVFNDQLSSGLSDAQWRFAATNYAGVQKMLRSDADRLRTYNPQLIILHYRLGLGLGYRTTQNDCEPTGDWLFIIDGDNWVQEWPGDSRTQEAWFYHWPQSGKTRVLDCDYGWYLMELNNARWRKHWQNEVLRQIKANDDDGVFMDSLSVPNYLGASSFRPPLPDYDPTFETAWSSRIDKWLAWLQKQPIGKYAILPNAGSWITTRDTTTYAAADGVMIEGFAIEANASPLPLSDWQLQMNRILGAVKRGQAVINQTYVTGARERLFAIGSYLLVKGDRTYINIDIGMDPEWYPEYDIPIGTPTNNAGTDIQNLYDSENRVYRRDFTNGFVLVNPTNPWDGSGITVTVDLGGTYRQAKPSGGGVVPANGVPTGTLTYRNVTKVTLPPYTAAIILNPVGAR